MSHNPKTWSPVDEHYETNRKDMQVYFEDSGPSRRVDNLLLMLFLSKTSFTEPCCYRSTGIFRSTTS